MIRNSILYQYLKQSCIFQGDDMTWKRFTHYWAFGAFLVVSLNQLFNKRLRTLRVIWDDSMPMWRSCNIFQSTYVYKMGLWGNVDSAGWTGVIYLFHDDVIKWEHLPRYWPFVRGIHRPQRPVTRSFDVFFDLCLNKRLNKQWWHRWFETPSRSLWSNCNEVHVIPGI